VVAQRVNGNSANFRIFTSRVVFRNELLNLVTHCVLTRNRGQPGSFCTTSSFKNRSSMTRFDATQFCSTFLLS
jgi:hypothetical protein